MVCIIAKIHETMGVLACCDKELLGKTLKRGKIEFRVSESFYSGNSVEEHELAQLLKEFDNINLVGEKTVAVAKKNGLVDRHSIIMIGKTPHIQIFKV